MMGPFEGKKYFISIEIIYKDKELLANSTFITK